jgi:O-antigen/teichoic acid export membrane protein
MRFSFKNTFSLLLIKGCAIGLRLLAMLLLAGVSAPSEFAVIAFIFSAAEVLRLVIDLGLDTYLLREHSIKKDGRPISLGDVFFVKIAAMGFFSAFLYLLSGWLNPTLDTSHWLLIFGFACAPLLQNISTVFLQAKNELLRLLPLYFTAGVIGCLFVFFSVPFIDSTLVLFILLCIEFFIAALSIYFLRANFRGSSFRLKEALAIYKNSFAIGFAIIVGASYAKLDVFFLAKMTSLGSMGVYALALRVLDPLMFVVGAYFSDVYAKMSAMPATKSSHVTQLSYLNKSVVAISGLTFIYICIAATGLFFYAKQYPNAHALVALVGLSVFFKVRNLAYSTFIIANGQFKSMSKISIYVFFLTLSSLYIGIYYFGIFGAALAVIFSEMLNTAIQFLVARRIQKTL